MQNTTNEIRETNAHMRRVLEQEPKLIGPRYPSGQFRAYDPRHEEYNEQTD